MSTPEKNENSQAIAAAKAKREEAATELYQLSRSRNPEDHASALARFNRANGDLHRIEGKRGDPPELRDAREDFSYTERYGVDENGNRLRIVESTGEVDDPASVINWRHTKVGTSQERSLQKSVAHGTGDDGGHIDACEFGADPAQRLNYGRQNPTQNQHGTYRQMERRVGGHCREDSNNCVRVKTSERYLVDKHGPDRPVGRVVERNYGRREGGQFVSGKKETLHFVNTKDTEAIKTRAGANPSKVEGKRKLAKTEEARERRLQALKGGAPSKNGPSKSR